MKTTIKRLFAALYSQTAKLLLAALAICAPLQTVQAATAPFVPNAISMAGGNNQSGAEGSTLSSLLSVAFSNTSYVISMDWQITSANASFSPGAPSTTSYTDPNASPNNPAVGQLSSVPVYLGSAPGTVNVTATMTACSDSGCSGTFVQTVNFTETITPPPPVTMSISGGNNQSAYAGYSLANPLSVAFTASANIYMEWKVTGGVAFFQESGTGDYVANDGSSPISSSSVHLIMGSTGPVTVSAICSGGCTTPPYTLTFNETATPPPPPLEMEVFSGTPQTGQPNTTLAAPLVVQLTRNPGFDGPFTFPLQWTVTSGTATFSQTHTASYSQTVSLNQNPNLPSATTKATVSLDLGATPGPVLVTVTCNTCTYGKTRYFRITIAEPVIIVDVTLQKASGDNQSGAVGTPADAPLVVQVGPPGFSLSQPGQPVNWSIISGQATLSAASTLIDTNGLASVTFTYGANPGPITIEASVGDVKADFTVTAFNAAVGVASGDNQIAVPGSTLQPFVIQLTPPATTSLAKSLGGATVTWTVNQGGGHMASATTVTDANGKSSNTLTLGPDPGINSVTATVAGTPADTVTFTASAIPAAANVVGISGNSQSGVAGTPLQPLVVQVTSNGKGVPGIGVNWSVNQGGGSLSAPSSITDANGNASNVLTLGPAAGTNSVTASIPGIGDIVFTAIASAPVATGSQFTLVSGNNQALIPLQASQPLVVKLIGPQGTPVSGAAVTWAVSGASGTLANATTPTDSSGQAQNQVTVVLPGSYTVTATLANAPSIPALTFSFNNAVTNLPGLTSTQIGVANAIDKGCPALAAMASSQLTSAQQDFLARCSEIVVGSGNNPQQVPNALNQMLNNKALPQRALADSMQMGQFANLNTRLGELRQGITGISIGGLTLTQDGRSLPLTMLGDAFRKDPKQDDEVGKDFERWGFFATGMIDRGGFDALAATPGFDYHNASLTAGVDYRFNADFVAGVALGYSSNNSSLDLNAGKLDVNGYSLNGYFTWYHNDDFYLEGSAIYNWLDYDMSRNIAYQIASLSGSGLTSVNQSANASPNGGEGSLALSVGKDFSRKAWTFSPYLRGVYSHLSLDGFSETMSDPNAPGAGLGTSVDARSMTSELGVIGGRISYTTSFDWGVLVPNAVLEWNHEFRNDPQTAVVRFLADPTQTPIVLNSTAPDQNYFNVGFGLNAVFARGRSAFVYYEHVVGYAGAHEDRLSVGIRIEF